ncbi:MAG TPA: L,D-transpeptidase family protein [Bacteroidia bacterium]|nr:L,D-transpeptidase family protein [Bacteroidia bacterium]
MIKQRTLPVLFLALFSLSFVKPPLSFKRQQLKYKTVNTAYAEKWDIVKSKLTRAGVDTSHFEIFLRIFKYEEKLELWARSGNSKQFTLVDTYDICRGSGTIGPKRREGDGQVPEGFYSVNAFQPASEFYLALGVSYPNKADLINGDPKNPGGDIMIHGNCVTIGCMPMTDEKIKEIYIMAVEARNNGEQNIPIHIFPTRMDEKGMALLQSTSSDKSLLAFWGNLKTGYNYFETKKTLPLVSVTSKGEYSFH